MTKDSVRPPPVPRAEPNQKQQPAAASWQAELDAFLGRVKALDAAVKAGEPGRHVCRYSMGKDALAAIRFRAKSAARRQQQKE
jgi:hypothetical protein